jgi:hypothetical protein
VEILGEALGRLVTFDAQAGLAFELRSFGGSPKASLLRDLTR